jgi:hypothetical protein
MRTPLLAFLPGLLTACQLFSPPFDEYYGEGAAPTISGVEPASSVGNVGGELVTISGSNFGLEPNAVVVVFGNSNADIVSISDNELQVRAPRGPLAGGAVDVKVGTVGGQARADDIFEYQVNRDLDDELAYIAVSNDYFSCYAGAGSPIRSGCETFAYSGYTGLDGYSEFLEYAFPRLHTAYVGQKGGFAGNHDESPGRWTVQNPPHDINTFDLEGLYEDRRIDIGEFYLRNPELRGQEFCVDETEFATWYRGGSIESDGTYYPPASLSYSGDLTDSECGGRNKVEYDMDEVRFCQVKDYDEPYKWAYESDWPVGGYFFTNDRDWNSLSDLGPVEIDVHLPGIAGDNGIGDGDAFASLTLPEYSVFTAYRGNSTAGDDAQGLFLQKSCDDTNGDGAYTLDDALVRWEWEPSAFEQDIVDPSEAKYGDVTSVRTYVRATLSLFTLGWLGGEGTPLRATITVEDDHNYDEETGVSYLELPAGVIYQFPTTFDDLGMASTATGVSTTMDWGDPNRSDYGYTVAALERVTEYTIKANVDGRDGVIVFAYSTGDMGLVNSSSGFTNPLDDDSCNNCIDDDGDGWTDEDDPDCTVERPGEGAVPAEDRFAEGLFSCNDGLDNDADGLIDAEDDDCEDGRDGETNCSDGIDNDGDGYTDAEDGECDEDQGGSGFELGEDDGDWMCADGLDNDGDGWTDLDDPDCESTADVESGLGDTACNDGIDNDGHGDIDAADPTCARLGGAGESEQPNFRGECIDATDNDGDGYVDGNDPDCEDAPYNQESDAFSEDAGAPICYNGADDDGDGFVDAADPGCVDGAGELDGFAQDEDAAVPGFTMCADGEDNDGDGWTDAADPDCDAGVSELGVGTTQCNDGDDNDGDGNIDSADTECADAADDDEES